MMTSATLAQYKAGRVWSSARTPEQARAAMRYIELADRLAEKENLTDDACIRAFNIGMMHRDLIEQARAIR